MSAVRIDPADREGAPRADSGVATARDLYERRVVLALLGLGALGAAIATVLHLSTGNPHPIDRIVPPLLAAGLLALFVWLLRRPLALALVVRLGLYGAGVGLALPTWYFAAVAHHNPSEQLIDLLPPVTAVLLPVMIAAIAFLPRAEARLFALGVWLMVALPVLGHFVFHPVELTQPTGRHLAFTLGPVSLMILALIPLFRGVERKLQTLEGERTRMQQLAERDALTGLYNRRAGEVWLREAVESHGPGVGVIVFDIDRFKQINDRFGHAAGDAVLCEVARRCGAAIRRSDVLMRWGGEEFLMLLRTVGQPELVQIAEQLRERCRSEPVGEVGVVTASFGATLWRPDEEITSTLERADQALYAAKDAGRDRVVALD